MDAATAPAAGSPPASETPARPASPAVPVQQNKGCGIGCLTVVVLIVAGIIGLIIAGAAHSSSPEGRAEDDRASAQITCEELVKKNVKAPSTASFSDESTDGTDPITVTGNVDAENSFGAKVRASFTCTATGTGNNLLVTLKSINQD
jgi:hypothetical protein